MQLSALKTLIEDVRKSDAYNNRLNNIVNGPIRSGELSESDNQKFRNISQAFKLVDRSFDRVKWELVSKHNLPTLSVVRHFHGDWSLALHHVEGFLMLEEALDSRVQVYLLASLWASYLQQWYRR